MGKSICEHILQLSRNSWRYRHKKNYKNIFYGQHIHDFVSTDD